jgi:hypothetical protein
LTPWKTWPRKWYFLPISIVCQQNWYPHIREGKSLDD